MRGLFSKPTAGLWRVGVACSLASAAVVVMLIEEVLVVSQIGWIALGVCIGALGVVLSERLIVVAFFVVCVFLGGGIGGLVDSFGSIGSFRGIPVAAFCAVVAFAVGSLSVGLQRNFIPALVGCGGFVVASIARPGRGGIASAILIAACVAVTSSRGGWGFEIRRLRNAFVSIALVGVVLVAAQNLGFLFPGTDRADVIPASKPIVSGPAEDEVLFSVSGSGAGPFRTGVLDTYVAGHWLVPPLDISSFVDVDGTASVAEASSTASTTEGIETKFSIEALDKGPFPVVVGTYEVVGEDLKWDPRSNVIRPSVLSDLTYSVRSPSANLDGFVAKPDSGFLVTPVAPPAIQSVLTELETFEPLAKLNELRGQLYSNVVVAGQGVPSEVSVGRAEQLFSGSEATPYELVAVEALLARWANVGSRIGFGYYGGDAAGSRPLEIRPRHAAVWLEVETTTGWVAIVGTPPLAKSSTQAGDRTRRAGVRPTEELALVVWVPVELERRLPAVATARWVASWLLSVAASAAALMFLWPVCVKGVRDWRRRRQSRTPKARIHASYAAFRNAAYDLGCGPPTTTPLEFLAHVENDSEHTDLAWLVTRTTWGDLRDVSTDEHALACERLCESTKRRLFAAAPFGSRVAAKFAWSSINQPYGEPRRPQRVISKPIEQLSRLLSFGRRMATSAVKTLTTRGGCLLLIVALALSSCATEPIAVSGQLPSDLVPSSVGSISFRRELAAEKAFSTTPSSLVSEGRVFSLIQQRDTLGALQVGALKTSAERDEVVKGIASSIGTGRFVAQRVGQRTMNVQSSSEQTIYLYISPSLSHYEIFVARRGFDEAPNVFSAVLDYQGGTSGSNVRLQEDPRRNGPL